MEIKYQSTLARPYSDSISTYLITDIEDWTLDRLAIELRSKGYKFEDDKDLAWHESYIKSLEPKENNSVLMTIIRPYLD